MAQCNHVVLSMTSIVNPPAEDNVPYESLTRVDNMPLPLGVCGAERYEEGQPFAGTYGHWHCNPAGTEVVVSTYNSAGCTGSINTTYTQAQMITYLNELATLTYSVTGIECKQQEPCAKFKRNCATGCGSTVLEADCNDNQIDASEVGMCQTYWSKSYVWKSGTNQDVKNAYALVSGSTMGTCVGTDSVKLQHYSDNNCQTKTTNMTFTSGCEGDVEMLVKCEIDGTAKEAPATDAGGAGSESTTAAPAPVSGARGRFSGLMMAAMTAAMAVAMVTM